MVAVENLEFGDGGGRGRCRRRAIESQLFK